MSGLQVTWFCLIGVLLAGYIIMDGFDLGVGFWYLFTKNDNDRRTLMSSILPYWDGNEVWLLTGGGAVFAAFPHVYATVFSGLYLALMIVLFALIFRAVSIEFMSQSESDGWKRFWSAAFSVGSIIPALLLGVAMGNILRGLPLDSQMNFTGSFFTLLNPYSLLIGVTGLAMFATHGALWAAMKTGGEISELSRRRAKGAWSVYACLFVVCVVVTCILGGHILANYVAYPFLWVFPALALFAILAIGHYNNKGMKWRAFLSSSLAMLAILLTTSASLFPNMVPAINDPAYSLTLMNASSTPLTLKTMLILALVGVPIMLVYTAWVHMMFKGEAGEEVAY
ncbi:MAG: cytochrome d ubiquinol oxidase subunit II [Armatimonadota bacterium]